MKEKYTSRNESINIKYEENKIKSIGKSIALLTSHRVHKDGVVGIHMHHGLISDEEGYRLAEANLVRQRPYPFELETGVRHREKTEIKYSELEVRDISRKCMDHLTSTYPDFTFTSYFAQSYQFDQMTNERGLDYSNTDSSVNVNISFKHKDSKDISDGSFSFSLRSFDFDIFQRMASDYLANYNTIVDFPEELIMDIQYYGVVGEVISHLVGENVALKTSLLADKIGQKVFSEDFTLYHDVTDEESWFSSFWDGDGCTFEDDKLLLIDHGRIVRAFADKHDALKYKLPHTGPSYMKYSDIPSCGAINARIIKSTKTIKELLDGRYAVIPLMAYGGGFNEKGDYTLPIHSSLLFDGEKILGRLSPFTAVSNMFDMFGKDYIGVGCDKPIYNDKQILFRINRGDL